MKNKKLIVRKACTKSKFDYSKARIVVYIDFNNFIHVKIIGRDYILSNIQNCKGILYDVSIDYFYKLCNCHTSAMKYGIVIDGNIVNM
jgi:hypothetical protein